MQTITFTRVGDYLLPDITLNKLPPVLVVKTLSRYGRMHKAYLCEHRPILYSQLVLSERLYPLCREVDETARERRQRGVPGEIILFTPLTKRLLDCDIEEVMELLPNDPKEE